ncbi:hypothetical protein JW805_08530 [Roseomonas aeriglobus]|nr:hypothetical protein [Roseomonas aeriglobus]
MADVFLSFNSARNEALTAIYRASYVSDSQEYYGIQEIQQLIGSKVGKVFLRKVMASLDEDSLVNESSYDEDGPYYTLTAKGWEAAETLIRALLKSENPVEGVPASDRVVTLTDNQRSSIADGLDEIGREIAQSNEAGSALGDQKDRIVAEFEAGKSVIRSRRVRLEALVGVLATPLRYLAEKFSGAAIGELAKKLLDVIWKVINS